MMKERAQLREWKKNVFAVMRRKEEADIRTCCRGFAYRMSSTVIVSTSFSDDAARIGPIVAHTRVSRDIVAFFKKLLTHFVLSREDRQKLLVFFLTYIVLVYIRERFSVL